MRQFCPTSAHSSQKALIESPKVVNVVIMTLRGIEVLLTLKISNRHLLSMKTGDRFRRLATITTDILLAV